MSLPSAVSSNHSEYRTLGAWAFRQQGTQYGTPLCSSNGRLAMLMPHLGEGEAWGSGEARGSGQVECLVRGVWAHPSPLLPPPGILPQEKHSLCQLAPPATTWGRGDAM